jgi:hypothetical protein
MGVDKTPSHTASIGNRDRELALYLEGISFPEGSWPESARQSLLFQIDQGRSLSSKQVQLVKRLLKTTVRQPGRSDPV